MNSITTLVLNWHITEACNYRCQYCYATWEASAGPCELVRDPVQTAALLGELYRFFRPGNSFNPLTKRLDWSAVRLNIAGGEPALYADRLMPIADQARGLGFDVSLISNGSLFNESLLKQLAPQLDWLGISIDSAMPSVNTAIGRVDRHGRPVDPNELTVGLTVARQVNPEVRIKINTVVNRLNHAEDLTPLIQRLAPDKWKALRMLPVANELLAVTDEQFATFVARHQSCGHIFHAENHQDMRESYLMIDPGGRFFQNSPLGAGQGYVYSQPILEVGVEDAFAEVAFAHERFCLRYAQDAAGEGV